MIGFFTRIAGTSGEGNEGIRPRLACAMLPVRAGSRCRGNGHGAVGCYLVEKVHLGVVPPLPMVSVSGCGKKARSLAAVSPGPIGWGGLEDGFTSVERVIEHQLPGEEVQRGVGWADGLGVTQKLARQVQGIANHRETQVP